MSRRCVTCCRGLPEWDTHARCSQHRECSKLRPCAACAIWSAPTWALEEAWHQAHPPIQRASALVPSAAPTPHTDVEKDLPADASVTPAPPGEASPSSLGISLDPHASGDSDWDTYDNPPRERAWRPAGADCGISLAGVFQPGANPIQTSGQSQAATLRDLRSAWEPPGSLPQPLAARIISRTSAVGWHTPPRIGGVSGKPTDPPVVGFTSLTSAVGRLMPPRIGGYQAALPLP